MEQRFYLVTGLILSGFFGFFALWTRDDHPAGDPGHTTLFWVSVGGVVVGVPGALIAHVKGAPRHR